MFGADELVKWYDNGYLPCHNAASYDIAKMVHDYVYDWLESNVASDDFIGITETNRSQRIDYIAKAIGAAFTIAIYPFNIECSPTVVKNIADLLKDRIDRGMDVGVSVAGFLSPRVDFWFTPGVIEKGTTYYASGSVSLVQGGGGRDVVKLPPSLVRNTNETQLRVYIFVEPFFVNGTDVKKPSLAVRIWSEYSQGSRQASVMPAYAPLVRPVFNARYNELSIGNGNWILINFRRWVALQRAALQSL
ncbi:hypothetical protein [Acidilobus sp.]|uniref:hypothetical protein n=1 Tax=Acidilobus sp. TaxID=1872109 RepID=UPI003D07367F